MVLVMVGLFFGFLLGCGFGAVFMWVKCQEDKERRDV